jgi:hypothetical protein
MLQVAGDLRHNAYSVRGMDPHAGGENKSWLVTMAGEDGPIAAKYGLWETPSASYLQRTAWYVRDSDGTAMSPELAGRTSRRPSMV